MLIAKIILHGIYAEIPQQRKKGPLANPREATENNEEEEDEEEEEEEDESDETESDEDDGEPGSALEG